MKSGTCKDEHYDRQERNIDLIVKYLKWYVHIVVYFTQKLMNLLKKAALINQHREQKKSSVSHNNERKITKRC